MQVTVSCPVYESFRVSQVAGLFDVTLEEKLQQSFEVETPSMEEDWNVGLIVGPSGSGKSTLA
ncbi:MAG: ABC transporter ATP-binding protein, partial [Planctomycetia bacterium]|nr:ABC transporter ATP-binding protein [Planctomycetia bacterium]